MLLEKYSFENMKQIVVDVWFSSVSFSFHTPSQVIHHLWKAVADIMSKFDAFMQKGSGWAVRQVKIFSLTVKRFTMFSGRVECMSFPLKLKRTQACIGKGKSCDNECFLRYIVAAALNKGKNVGRWCKAYENALCAMDNASSKFLSFPVDMKGIKKFEKKWPICINVYGYSGVI